MFCTIYVAEKQFSRAKYSIHVVATIEVTANEFMGSVPSRIILSLTHRNIASMNFRLTFFVLRSTLKVEFSIICDQVLFSFCCNIPGRRFNSVGRITVRPQVKWRRKTGKNARNNPNSHKKLEEYGQTVEQSKFLSVI